MMSSMSDATLDVPALRQILRRYSAIASLEDHVLAPLAAGAERLEVPRRRAIFTREQVGPGLLFVVEGSLKICLFSPEGREQLLYLADPGMMIAEGLSLDGRPCRASAFALDDAVGQVRQTALGGTDGCAGEGDDGAIGHGRVPFVKRGDQPR